jgi:ribosomal protein S18 acetylase RimI-like enzyme
LCAPGEQKTESIAVGFVALEKRTSESAAGAQVLSLNGTLESTEQLSSPDAVELGTLEVADLPRVSEIHLAAFPKSALTMLGAEAVRRYYEWLLTGPHESFAMGASVKADLMGFCFGGVFRGAMSGFLRQNRAFLFGRVLSRPWLSMNPLFRRRAAMALRILRRFGRQEGGKPNAVADSAAKPESLFGILAIAVHPDSHGQGIGRALMDEAERSARRCDFKEMQLTVEMSNHQAISFYESLSWEKILNQGAWHGEMRKALRG